MPSPHQPVVQNAVGGLKPYACAVGVDYLHVVVKAWRASAAGYYYIFKIGYFKQHAVLHIAKPFFAVSCEYVAYIGHESTLNVVVKVNELQSGIFGKGAGKSGFAAPHVSYEEDGLCHVGGGNQCHKDNEN